MSSNRRRVDHFGHHAQQNLHNANHTNLLNDIKTNTANIKLEAETIDINVADLEVLQTAANNTLSSIDNKVILPSVLDSDRLKVYDSAVIGSLAQINNNLDGVESGLILIETDIETTNSKLDTINTTLTAGGVVDTSALATHAKQDTINSTLGDTNSKIDAMRGTSDLGVINTSLGTLTTINSTLGDTNSKIDAVRGTSDLGVVNTTLGTLATSVIQTNGTQQAKCMGIGDDGANKQMKTDNSGNVSAFLVSDVVMKPSNITNGDHASFSGSSVASMLRCRTDINNNATGVFLLCDSAGSLSVNSKSTLVKTTGEWLATSTAIGDDVFSASLDCSSFREVRVFGKNASAIGPASIPIMGSQTDGGTYYKIGEITRDSVDISGVSELHYSGKVEMPTNFIKIYNNSGSGITCEFDYVGFSV